MPYCKNCRSRLDRFSKDRCPICGAENPFDGVSSDTVEITTNIDTSDLKLNYHPKNKTIFLWLFTLGMFGAPYFYIYKTKQAIIWLIVNIVLFVGAVLGLVFGTTIHPAIVVVCSFVLFMVVNFVIGVFIYNKPNLKDGHGDFLA